MRSISVISLLAASLALLSQSPATYAAPVPSGGKRSCLLNGCRIAEVSSDTASAPQSPVISLVDTLIAALQQYRSANTPSNTTTLIDFATPAVPETEDTTTTP